MTQPPPIDPTVLPGANVEQSASARPPKSLPPLLWIMLAAIALETWSTHAPACPTCSCSSFWASHPLASGPNGEGWLNPDSVPGQRESMGRLVLMLPSA